MATMLYPRSVDRLLAEELLPALPAIFVVGPRGSGKSTSMSAFADTVLDLSEPGVRLAVTFTAVYPVGAQAWRTTAYSAKPPSASQPVYRGPGHRLPAPDRHHRHDPQALRNQATPTRPPSENRDASHPRLTTSPTI